MNSFSDFILTPIRDILNDVVAASAGIGSGIETFPLCDYTMQSVFIRMTGFQEQKMKCICWEMAANDHDYRYEFTKKPLGECSSYKEKVGIYKDLIIQITKHHENFNVATFLDRQIILGLAKSEVYNIFENTNLSSWAQKSFNDFNDTWPSVKKDQFAIDATNLLAEINKGISLKKIYDEHLYRNRNRVAHNTQSYQQNLPTLKALMDDNYKYENYFIWFAILVLLDYVFIRLYEKYLINFQEAIPAN